jgi:tetratricopeptide (TPR) repeat protein
MAELDPWEAGSRVRYREDFVSGLKCFRNGDWEGALNFFRHAVEQADLDDVYRQRYTSYHGLARVRLGDRNGVKLCREAAVGERHDAEVFYNLAVAENELGFRESAYTALRRGLGIDASHAGLQRLAQQFRLREQRAVIPALPREHMLNRLLGRLFRGTRIPYIKRDR